MIIDNSFSHITPVAWLISKLLSVQGLYEDSIRYYVRAVSMNPKADNAWQYLRISLGNASRSDMIAACDSRNLDVLQKEFPL
ncbi:unnamed protein product [Triticum turgidum subsp. durum]|uniref:Peroxin-5 n=1 Tax=Triticum turgidum subsp. durum TaxID=4567 RepID=A0A9R1BZJ7_TRITD|nr:unnamed protein product [Triticum turgidum subsp. durum]